MNTEEVDKEIQEYLKEAPKGPYRDLVESLVTTIDYLRGDIQDAQVELNYTDVFVKVLPCGNVSMVSRDPEALEYVLESLRGPPRGPDYTDDSIGF